MRRKKIELSDKEKHENQVIHAAKWEIRMDELQEIDKIFRAEVTEMKAKILKEREVKKN